MTIPESKKIWVYFAVGLAWFFILLWPLMGLKPEGVSFGPAFAIWWKVALVLFVLLVLYRLKKRGYLDGATGLLAKPAGALGKQAELVPAWAWIVLIAAASLVYPFFVSRYGIDVAVTVMVYICLGLGLNIVIGLCGLLDLGYIAFFGVGAYTYALLSVNYGISFWLGLPLAALAAMIAGCIIGYPTLRMRGDYLAIVTLGFGEIVRLILINWMALTNGPNGVLGIKKPGLYLPGFTKGLSLEHIYLTKLEYLYYVILALAVFTILAVHRLNFSRIGRAWEAIREDETAAELMGVNTFKLKLMAYAMGAVFGGMAGAFFAGRMGSVSPQSFSFIESAMVLSMVILGGMGSIPGVILGALALVALPEIFRGFELYRMLVFGGSMVLMMIFRPKGLWPAKRVGERSEDKV